MCHLFDYTITTSTKEIPGIDAKYKGRYQVRSFPSVPSQTTLFCIESDELLQPRVYLWRDALNVVVADTQLFQCQAPQYRQREGAKMVVRKVQLFQSFQVPNLLRNTAKLQDD